ncbi:MAG: fimbrillin family protein [Bacteroidales bacterium]|nr:fimbrillin family protein [Bacteroidales bacterium]
MKKIYYFLAFTMAMGMAACSDDDVVAPNIPNHAYTGDDIEVSISTTDIEFKSSVTTEFSSSTKMNIFAKTYGQVSAPDIVSGICATYDGANLTMEPKILMNNDQKNAFIFAVAPYDASYTDAAKIPVDMNKQIDLMYSGAYVPASLTSPSVKLTMKHALSLLTFNIVPVNYSGSATLKNIKIEGENVYATGTMDVSTGKITLGEVGAVSASQDKAVADGGWKSDLPGIWALPFNTKAGDVKITFTIDSKTYQLTLPETEMKYGYQYIYRMALTNNGLEFDPSMTEMRSLNVDTDETPEFVGYGKIQILTSGSWINTPYFTGDAVFGTITTPSQNISYESAIKLDGLSSGNTVIVESWNSEGFEIETLDGIDTIDLTQYE